MQKDTKRLIKHLPLLRQLYRWRTRRRYLGEVARWERAGRPVPPPHWIKQQRLRDYAGKYRLCILVETGTFYGEMVEAMLSTFERIYSIELSDQLCQQAQDRFRTSEQVEIIHGDSATEIARVLPRLDRPTLFWLDGHYSGGETAKGSSETPIVDELRHIFEAPDRGHVVLIDDARLFGTNPCYPTLDEIKSIVAQHRPAWSVIVENDCICLAPKGAA